MKWIAKKKIMNQMSNIYFHLKTTQFKTKKMDKNKKRKQNIPE